MKRVTVAVRVENIHDVLEAGEGHRPPDAVRRIDIPDAVIDTEARMLSLPLRNIQELGLHTFGTRGTSSGGGRSVDLFSAVRLTIAGRQCTVDVAALPDDQPVVVGRIPLTQLDFIVDPIQQKLVGNPRHNGKFMIDMM